MTRCAVCALMVDPTNTMRLRRKAEHEVGGAHGGEHHGDTGGALGAPPAAARGCTQVTTRGGTGDRVVGFSGEVQWAIQEGAFSRKQIEEEHALSALGAVPCEALRTAAGCREAVVG